MKLLHISELIGDFKKQDNYEKILDILCQNAEMFYRAGGIITLNEWAELDTIEREAFILGRESLRLKEELKFYTKIVYEQLDSKLESYTSELADKLKDKQII